MSPLMLVNFITAAILLILGLYCMCTQKNLIKVILGMGIMDYGINLLIVSIGFNANGTAPIFTLSDLLNGVTPQYFVDPIPQALTLTSIVIGACVDAMALSLVVMINRKYKSVNADDVRRLRG